MNWYCFDCGAVWYAMCYEPDHCSDCSGQDISSQSALTERFVRECLMPLPSALVTQIGASDKALVRWLCEKLSGQLDYQDMILNGPFAKADETSEDSAR